MAGGVISGDMRAGISRDWRALITSIMAQLRLALISPFINWRRDINGSRRATAGMLIDELMQPPHGGITVFILPTVTS